jgi:hypothetical protein
LTDRTEALMTPFWEVLTTPVFSTIEPGVTAVSPIAGLAVLVLGWAAHRVLRKKAATFAGTHPEWPEERVKAILTVGSTAMGLGTVLTAFQVAGFSLDTIHFVWRLFNAPLLVVAGTDVSVVTILTVCGVVYGGFWVSDLSQRGVKAWAGQRHNMEAGTVATVQRLLHYLVVGLSGIVALQTIGIKLDALLATGAVFAVGFGLAMQGIAQNFVSGIILLLERSIRPGDVVEVDETMVRSKRWRFEAPSSSASTATGASCPTRCSSSPPCETSRWGPSRCGCTPGWGSPTTSTPTKSPRSFSKQATAFPSASPTVQRWSTSPTLATVPSNSTSSCGSTSPGFFPRPATS